MLKIISGKFKGRKLNNIKVDSIRPTSALVKKSIMDSIMFFENKNILDLCCGVGTLGIEAISRGAQNVDFVDNSRNSINILKKNIELLDINNSCTVYNSDMFRFLKKHASKYDVVFADPPYYKYNFFELLPIISRLINKNGILVYESEKFKIVEQSSIKTKTFGNTQITFFKEKQ